MCREDDGAACGRGGRDASDASDGRPKRAAVSRIRTAGRMACACAETRAARRPGGSSHHNLCGWRRACSGGRQRPSVMRQRFLHRRIGGSARQAPLRPAAAAVAVPPTKGDHRVLTAHRRAGKPAPEDATRCTTPQIHAAMRVRRLDGVRHRWRELPPRAGSACSRLRCAGAVQHPPRTR